MLPPCMPPPMPPPRPNADDPRASVVARAPAMRQLRTLLFIEFPPWLNLRQRPPPQEENNQKPQRMQRFQMTKATVSDTEVSFIDSQAARRSRTPALRSPSIISCAHSSRHGNAWRTSGFLHQGLTGVNPRGFHAAGGPQRTARLQRTQIADELPCAVFPGALKRKTPASLAGSLLRSIPDHNLGSGQASFFGPFRVFSCNIAEQCHHLTSANRPQSPAEGGSGGAIRC